MLHHRAKKKKKKNWCRGTLFISKRHGHGILSVNSLSKQNWRYTVPLNLSGKNTKMSVNIKKKKNLVSLMRTSNIIFYSSKQEIKIVVQSRTLKHTQILNCTPLNNSKSSHTHTHTHTHTLSHSYTYIPCLSICIHIINQKLILSKPKFTHDTAISDR